MDQFAVFSRRHIGTAAVIVFIEVIFYRQYASLDAEFHFWLHGLFGASLGLLALAIWKIFRPASNRMSPFEAGFIGHAYSAIPDVIFIMFGVLHMYWMDVLALHISIHFIPAPIPTMLAVFLLSLLAYGLVADGARKYGAMTLLGTALILAVALVLRQPIPTSLKQVQNHDHTYGWLCPMWDIDSRYSIRQ